jgi:hypothetical protein
MATFSSYRVVAQEFAERIAEAGEYLVAAPGVPTLQIVRPFPKFLSDGVAPIDHTALVCITPNCRRTSGERASTSCIK